MCIEVCRASARCRWAAIRCRPCAGRCPPAYGGATRRPRRPRPPAQRPGRRLAVVRARCRRVGSDRRGRRGAVVCPLIGVTRLSGIHQIHACNTSYLKFCSPVTSAPLYDDTRCGVHRYASRTALTLRGIPIDPISRHATTRRQIGNYPVHLQCRAHPHILAVPASKIQRYKALSFLLSSHTVHPRAKSS